ncbi:MAG: GrpB family protein [Anaerolineales bacterium]
MPTDPSSGSDELQGGVIGERKRLDGTIYLATYDPHWPGMFSELSLRVREALGDRSLRLEHVGSTSVEGLMAKPIIDMLLVVADSRDEVAYVPDLEAKGFTLRRREPEWFEHRLFRHLEPRANLHVFSFGCPEIDRMLTFRDWLRSHAEDRALYQAAKQNLAGQQWAYVQDYADAKMEIIREIMSRANE